MKTESPYTLFMRMRHGCGDNVQASIVLKHLNHYHPDWQITVESPLGTQDCYRGLCHSAEVLSYPFRQSGWSRAEYMKWPKPRMGYQDVPSTKVTRTLTELFQLKPIEDLYYYHVHQSEDQKARAAEYLASLPQSRGVALIHYGGNSSPERKDLSFDEVATLCDGMAEYGFLPVLLDFKHDQIAKDLVDQEAIFCPYALWQDHPQGGQYADAGLIAALIQQSAYFFGIDSGPGHIAAATTTPSFLFWKETHPVHCFDLSHNVTHFVPHTHYLYLCDDWSVLSEQYFNDAYRTAFYKAGDLEPYLAGLCDMINESHDNIGVEVLMEQPQPGTLVLESKSHGQLAPPVA